MEKDPSLSTVLYDIGYVIGMALQFYADHWMVCTAALASGISAAAVAYSNKKSK